MIDYKVTPQDMQALGEHSEALERARKQEKLQSAVLVKVCEDERLADIVRVFEAGDERRKQTMWCMAKAMRNCVEGC